MSKLKGSGIEGYNMSKKEKEELCNVRIDMTRTGGYMAKGTFKSTEKGGVSILNKEKALAAIEEGRATKGEGWDGIFPDKEGKKAKPEAKGKAAKEEPAPEEKSEKKSKKDKKDKKKKKKK